MGHVIILNGYFYVPNSVVATCISFFIFGNVSDNFSLLIKVNVNVHLVCHVTFLRLLTGSKPSGSVDSTA